MTIAVEPPDHIVANELGNEDTTVEKNGKAKKQTE